MDNEAYEIAGNLVDLTVRSEAGVPRPFTSKVPCHESDFTLETVNPVSKPERGIHGNHSTRKVSQLSELAVELRIKNTKQYPTEALAKSEKRPEGMIPKKHWLKKFKHRTSLSPFPYLPTSSELVIKVCQPLALLNLVSQQQVPDLRLRQAR